MYTNDIDIDCRLIRSFDAARTSPPYSISNERNECPELANGQGDG